jgi:hypothetical protein
MQVLLNFENFSAEIYRYVRVLKTAFQPAKNLEKFGPRKTEVNRYTQ